MLFCIDASPSMYALQEPDAGGERKSHVQAALEGALALQRRKIQSTPADLVGIMLYNTVRRISILV